MKPLFCSTYMYSRTGYVPFHKLVGVVQYMYVVLLSKALHMGETIINVAGYSYAYVAESCTNQL